MTVAVTVTSATVENQPVEIVATQSPMPVDAPGVPQVTVAEPPEEAVSASE